MRRVRSRIPAIIIANVQLEIRSSPDIYQSLLIGQRSRDGCFQGKGITMKRVVDCLKLALVACVVLAVSSVDFLYAAAAQSPEQLFAELAKLKPDQRIKRLE